VRPVLSVDEIQDIHDNLKSAESTFWLPAPLNDVVKVRHFTHVDDNGNFEPPHVFYEGVIYGLTWESSHQLEVSSYCVLKLILY
jgi:hypothetical protein